MNTAYGGGTDPAQQSYLIPAKAIRCHNGSHRRLLQDIKNKKAVSSQIQGASAKDRISQGRGNRPQTFRDRTADVAQEIRVAVYRVEARGQSPKLLRNP
jgi:hypothetical protein